ncbi:MAG TPA: cysteine desulfurase family protein [Propionibacteriaceae bacterium]|nr:cysteine desulfurase family protein [Propionibacteriaceae bacterium]
MSRIYLDHAATTPMIPEAVEVMTHELTRVGNASSLHASGRSARRVVEESREAIAAQVGAQPAEVIFTSGGTESDNLAIKGAVWAGIESGRRRVVTSAIEHHAVLDSVAWLGQSATAEVSYAPVDSDGRLNMSALTSAVDSETALVSVMWANNEVGALQPVRQIADLAAVHGAISHSDAVQAVGHVDVNFAASGLDLLSFTAHKLGGPYGIGALLARRELRLAPILHGGGQERDVRSGTLDVAAAAGFAAALDLAIKTRVQEEQRIRRLRRQLVNSVLAAVPWAIWYGPRAEEAHLPGIASIGFPGCSADAILMLLDAAGIDCATGAACSAGVSQPSHVLTAMGCSEAEARSALRFSLGHTSTLADVLALAAALPEAVRRAKAAAAVA